MKQPTPHIKATTKGVIVLKEKNIKEQPEHIRKGWELMQKNKDEILFPKKYYTAQKTLIRAELHQCWEQQPGTPLKDIVASVVQNLPDFIPGDRILELIQFTIREWQKLVKKEEVSI